MKTKGFFWHVHHNELVEWSDNIQERIDYINKDKPKQEIALRLKLLQPVNGKLPDEYVKADEARVKAYKAWEKAREKYKSQIEELHNKECPNCPWNGTTIFVKEAGIE